MAVARVRTSDNLGWVEIGLPPQAPSANTVTSDAAVQPTASKITVSPNSLPPATPAVNDLWVVNDVASITTSSIGEIDHSERNSTWDIAAVGTTYTDVEGLQITVNPQTQPYMVTFSGMLSLLTGTSANGTNFGAFIRLFEVNASQTWAYVGATVTQVGTTSLPNQLPVFMGRRMLPHTTQKIYRVQTRTSTAVPSGWQSLTLLASDAPFSGVYPPAYLRAEIV